MVKQDTGLVSNGRSVHQVQHYWTSLGRLPPVRTSMVARDGKPGKILSIMWENCENEGE